MKKILALSLALIMVFVLVACSNDTADSGSQAPEASSAAPAEKSETPAETEDNGGSEGGKTGKVALILKSLNHAFFADMQEAAKEKADELGMEIYIDGVIDESDNEGIIQLIENAITQQCDVIAVTTSDSTALVQSVKKCNDAGIPFITIDADIDQAALDAAGAEVVTFIGTDNREGGRLIGEYCAELFKDASEEVQVAILEGLPGTETATNRKAGFEEGISSNDKIKVVASQNADWQIELGLNVGQNILQANPDIEFIFGSNDYMALGALQAAIAANLDVQVMGFDAIQDALDSIKDGKLFGTLGQFPGKMGATAVQMAYELINDPSKTYDRVTYTGCYVVTKENLDDYLAEAKDLSKLPI
ncbi:MAG: sugar ABC transporter substrate-binding protein [Christensenellales bacterium]|jgi:ribose transport system substrate-binding protein